MNTLSQKLKRGLQIKSFSFLLFFFLLTLSIFSCSDDFNEESNNHPVLMKKSLLDSFNDDEPTSIRTDSIDETFYNVPNLAELTSIADAIDIQGSAEGWLSNLILIYGYPDWDMAIINDITSSDKVIILPFVKDNEVRGIIRCYDLLDINFFKFYGHNYITGIPEGSHDAFSIGEAKNFASNYLYYEYILRQNYNLELMSWRQSVDEDIRNEEEVLEVRNDWICITTTESWWSCAGSPENPYIDCDFFTETTEDCYTIIDPGGGWTGTFPGSNIDPLDSNPNAPNPNADNGRKDKKDKDQKDREERVKNCLELLEGFASIEIAATKSSLESLYGEKICVDDLSTNIIDGLIIEGIIDCENDRYSEAIAKIKAELTSIASNQASVFDQVMAEIIASDISDPCYPDLTPDDIANNALTAMQASGDCGVEGLQEALDGSTKINPTLAFNNCDAYNCVLEYLLNNENQIFCAQMNPIFDSDIFDVVYDVGPIIVDGDTDINAETNTISMTFNSSDCDKTKVDLLRIAETLLHEGQHAVFNSHLIDSGLDIGSVESKRNAWQLYAAKHFGIEYKTQHSAMVDDYLENAALFLWNLNNQEGTIEHYKFYIYQGLPSYLFNGRTSEIEAWEALYNELNNEENGFNLFNC